MLAYIHRSSSASDERNMKSREATEKVGKSSCFTHSDGTKWSQSRINWMCLKDSRVKVREKIEHIRKLTNDFVYFLESLKWKFKTLRKYFRISPIFFVNLDFPKPSYITVSSTTAAVQCFSDIKKSEKIFTANFEKSAKWTLTSLNVCDSFAIADLYITKIYWIICIMIFGSLLDVFTIFQSITRDCPLFHLSRHPPPQLFVLNPLMFTGKCWFKFYALCIRWRVREKLEKREKQKKNHFSSFRRLPHSQKRTMFIFFLGCIRYFGIFWYSILPWRRVSEVNEGLDAFSNHWLIKPEILEISNASSFDISIANAVHWRMETGGGIEIFAIWWKYWNFRNSEKKMLKEKFSRSNFDDDGDDGVWNLN